MKKPPPLSKCAKDAVVETLGDMMAAYDTFGWAAGTKALKVVIER